MDKDYKEKIDIVARKDDLSPEDFEFLAIYFNKNLLSVVTDVIERRTIIELAHRATQNLN